MTIYIAQGHEKSIGLEILLKSLSCLSPEEIKKFCLITFHSSLADVFATIKLGEKNKKHIPAKFIKENDSLLPQTTQSLLECLRLIKASKSKKKSILLTLPTSKDQLILNGKLLKGYTEFFRTYYHNPNLPMVFKGPYTNVLLITDHIPLVEVVKLSEELIFEKIKITLENFPQYFSPIEEVVLSGINPHAGENGLLGNNEEKNIINAISKLKKLFPKVSFIGPVSGDTLFFHKKSNNKQLFVYMYHDQALSIFKSLYGIIGLNITLGLPFLRLSVDHGTAFELYGKNQANYLSALYMLKTALEIKNESYESKKYP
ncbi:MAG: 4-hydroxythreonine-4-phosphate dehydrogenase PdxA [Oligoflexia bacterium]|nr:4-hydroxythreonine-4-phosphate dehydrogenase PdxA [Oligoflexia bacterium]MBF0367214.1 4-hydroxythreonine-4-phosphate dehydrogenase PdxA [Oligoflexia bacterium]